MNTTIVLLTHSINRFPYFTHLTYCVPDPMMLRDAIVLCCLHNRFSNCISNKERHNGILLLTQSPPKECIAVINSVNLINTLGYGMAVLLFSSSLAPLAGAGSAGLSDFSFDTPVVFKIVAIGHLFTLNSRRETFGRHLSFAECPTMGLGQTETPALG